MATSATGASTRHGASQTLRRVLLFAGIAVVLGVGLWILAPSFYRPANLLNVARQASFVGVIAIGQTFVILTGGIDLSVGAASAVCGVITAELAVRGWPPELILIAVLALGALIGLVNAIGVTNLKMQPFIMTLASTVALTGVALIISHAGPVLFVTPGNLTPIDISGPIWQLLGSGDIAGIPGPALIFAIVTIAATLALRYLAFGRYIYAVGGSIEAARLSGVRTNRTIGSAYVISGMCAGLVGMMVAARLQTGDPNAGSLANLDSITAVVMGGTSLMGGAGGVVGTAVGALVLGFLSNAMNLIGIDPYSQYVVKGFVIVAAVLFAQRAASGRLAERRVATTDLPKAAGPGPDTSGSGGGSPLL